MTIAISLLAFITQIPSAFRGRWNELLDRFLSPAISTSRRDASTPAKSNLISLTHNSSRAAPLTTRPSFVALDPFPFARPATFMGAMTGTGGIFYFRLGRSHSSIFFLLKISMKRNLQAMYDTCVPHSAHIASWEYTTANEPRALIGRTNVSAAKNGAL